MLKLFNTFTRRKEVFTPIKDRKVGMYTCGPSVYTHPHIGNYRTYLFEDVLKRYLLYKGYKVKHVMNITDVENKMIRAAKKEKKSLTKISNFYTKVFFKESKKLCILPADFYPRATQHVGDMVEIIKKLLKKGYAYKWPDGNIYFDISKFKGYGKLSRLKVTREMRNRRLTRDDYYKWEAGDFVLWRSCAKSDGDIFWRTELGKGRPGWSIECSAMSTRYLGKHFDIHTGGIDNIFSHHENGIAQSEGSSGKKFVNYWVHSKHLIVNGKKMSKSLGNCYVLDDLLKRDFNPNAVRYVLISTHYRKRLDFTFQKMRKASNEIRQYYRCIKKIKDLKNGKHNQELGTLINEVVEAFEKSMDDDLDTTKAIEAYFSFIKKLYTLAKEKNLDGTNKKEITRAVKRINSVLGFLLPCQLTPKRSGDLKSRLSKLKIKESV
jgi:cysteinyl-tRNA synthetase